MNFYDNRRAKVTAILLIFAVLSSTFFVIFKNRNISSGTSKIKKEMIAITYFYNNPCAACNEEKKFYDEFNKLVGNEKEGIEIEFKIYNTFHENDAKVLQQYFERYKIPKEEQLTPALFIGDDALIGNNQIISGLKDSFLKAKTIFIERRKSSE